MPAYFELGLSQYWANFVPNVQKRLAQLHLTIYYSKSILVVLKKFFDRQLAGN